MLVTCYVSAGLSTPCQYSSADSFRIRERHPEGNNSFFRGEMGGGGGQGECRAVGGAQYICWLQSCFSYSEEAIWL